MVVVMTAGEVQQRGLELCPKVQRKLAWVRSRETSCTRHWRGQAHIGVKPRTLPSREEYQPFDLTQFRNHIYKEQTRQKKEAYYSKQKNG
jgi:hypothetical protein